MIYKSVLDKIIQLENEFLEKNKIPTIMYIGYRLFISLTKEVESSYFMDNFHGMKVSIVPKDSIELG